MLVVAWALNLAAPAYAIDPSAEYAREVSVAQLRMAHIEAQMAELGFRIEQIEEFARGGHGSTATDDDLVELNTQIARLRGSIEVIGFQLSKLAEEQGQLAELNAARQDHQEQRLDQLEAMLGVKPPPLVTEAEGEPGQDAIAEFADESFGDSAIGQLERAASHMEAGRQKVARVVLQRALVAFPDAAETAEIRYRLAETFLNEERWGDAVVAFDTVINNHAKSEWKCWSFLRQGEAFEGWGRERDAEPFYRGATENDCADTPAADEAAKRL